MSIRKSSPAPSSESAENDAPASDPARTQGKGRPTRSRREAEAARHRPLVVTDRKEARRRSREKAQAERSAAQRALVTGDETHMPYQHRGAQRRFARDVVDSRYNLPEFFFPVAVVLLLVAITVPMFRPDLQTTMSSILVIIMWSGVAACVIDAFVMRSRLRRELTARFGSVDQGVVGYAIMRAIQIRRLRLPKPMIRRGEAPRA